MGTFETFDPKDMIVNVNGFIISGFGEQMISIARPDVMWNMVTGATGDVCRVKTNNFSADVTMTLQQTSPFLDILNDIANADETESRGVCELTITYRKRTNNQNENVMFKSTTAFIEKKPDSSWANTPQDREFVFKCAQSEFDLGKSSTDDHKYAVIGPGEGA